MFAIILLSGASLHTQVSIMCNLSTPTLSDISDDDMDLTAAAWETVPDEDEVQGVWEEYVQNWKSHTKNIIVDLYYPPYLKEFGHLHEGCNNYEAPWEPPFDQSQWLIWKYLDYGMTRRNFLIGYNEAVEQTPFDVFNVHGNGYKRDMLEGVKCNECQLKNFEPEYKPVSFHAHFDVADEFVEFVAKKIDHYFCERCNGFLWQLEQCQCYICINICEVNDPYCYVSGHDVGPGGNE